MHWFQQNSDRKKIANFECLLISFISNLFNDNMHFFHPGSFSLFTIVNKKFSIQKNPKPTKQNPLSSLKTSHLHVMEQSKCIPSIFLSSSLESDFLQILKLCNFYMCTNTPA